MTLHLSQTVPPQQAASYRWSQELDYLIQAAHVAPYSRSLLAIQRACAECFGRANGWRVYDNPDALFTYRVLARGTDRRARSDRSGTALPLHYPVYYKAGRYASAILLFSSSPLPAVEQAHPGLAVRRETLPASWYPNRTAYLLTADRSVA
jgi:hypothetical protein